MKFALCNEIFREKPLEDAFRLVADIGYAGVEVAPFTLRANPLELNESDADRCRTAAEAAGLEVVGLHWLMAETEGLHLTRPEPEVRDRTVDYLKQLVLLTARMRGSVMVLGSPQQRNLVAGTLYETAFRQAVGILREVCDLAAEHGVVLAVEPLSPVETSFLSSCAEARRLVAAVNRPACRLHLDIKAMAHEPAGPVATIHEHRWEVAHFHANDVNRRGPGQGPTALQPVVDALVAIGYGGWVSVEPFDYHPTPVDCARISLANLRRAFRQD